MNADSPTQQPGRPSPHGEDTSLALRRDELWNLLTHMLDTPGHACREMERGNDVEHRDEAQKIKHTLDALNRRRVMHNVRKTIGAGCGLDDRPRRVSLASRNTASTQQEARVLPVWVAVAAVLLLALLSSYTAGTATLDASLPTAPANANPPNKASTTGSTSGTHESVGTLAGDSVPGVKPGSERDAELAYREFKLAEPATPSHASRLGHDTTARCRKRSRVWLKSLRAWRRFLIQLDRPLLAMPIIASMAERSLPASREQMDALLDLGRLCAKEGDPLGATVVLRHVVEHGTGQAPRAVASALAELAALAGEANDANVLEELLRRLERVRASEAKQIHVWGVLGEVHLRAGNRRGAKKALKRAERIYNDALTRGGEHKVKNLVRAWLDLKLRKALERDS